MVKKSELRKISDTELQQILEEHKKWVKSDEIEGKREGKRADLGKAYLRQKNLENAYLRRAKLKNAHLRRANLQGAKLNKANLKKANFSIANLQNAELSKANLHKAILRSANLQGAKLKEAILQKTNLSNAILSNTVLDKVTGLSNSKLKYANFQGATGLLGNEFAQADVTGTILPDDIKEFKALETVKETSQNARKIFFAMLLGCVYSWLTIATTTDVKLLTNTASSPLPIIGTEIPIAWFYIAAPLVLIALYLYFHFYLQGLWESLSSLPAIFSDGKRLDERAYPWLLNRLVRKHFKLLKDDRPNMAKLQELVIIALAWWVVPITLVGFWLRYLVRHEFIGTSIHIVLLILLITISFIFYNLCKFILKGKDVKTIKLKDFWYTRNSFWVFIICYILILISNYGFTNWGANFREKDISIKPRDYYKIEDFKKQIEAVKGANLRGMNLKNADMYDAFLVKADFRDANLQNANIRKSSLRWANLQRTDLSYAELQNASFKVANLQNANFEEAILQETNLEYTNLTGAQNLTINQLSKVKTLYQASLDHELFKEVNKCCPHLLEQPTEETDHKNKTK